MGRKKLTQTELFLMIILVVYSIIVTIVNPAFLSLETLFDMIRSASGTMILAMGVLVVIISGGIDVSFTAIAIFGGYTSTTILVAMGVDSLALAILISCGIGLALGLLNAIAVHWLNLEPFIVTLGTSSIIYGAMTTFIGTENIGARYIPKGITAFGSMKLFGIEDEYGAIVGLSGFVIPVIIVIFATWFILYKTMLGKGIFATGCSKESAKRAGFKILSIHLFIYSFVGALAGIMGIVYIAEVNACNPISLVGDELMIIAAVVIGGAKITGGQGTILGTILGVFVVYLLNSTLIFLGFSSSWNDLFVGIILLISIVVTSYQERVKNRKNFIFTE